MARILTTLKAALLRLRARVVTEEQGEPLMLGLGVAVGLVTGVLAAVLVAGIRLVQSLAWGESASGLELVLVPALGALAVGILLRVWAYEPSGSGVVRVMAATAQLGGRLRARVPAAGMVASSIALGTGASGGREGPIVLIGSGSASLIGRLFALGEERKRTLIAAGAAAGIGASFNAPLGGMLFAVELLLGELRGRTLQVVVVASVAGSVTARQLIGPDIIYEPATNYTWNGPAELALYALLSVGAVAIGLGFLYGEELAGEAFERLRVWPPLRLALAGALIGLIALLAPEVLGTGAELPPITGVREPIQRMLDGGYGIGFGTAGLLLGLAALKLVATCLSIGSGNAVGTFAPAIFCGAALGAAFGAAATALFPGLGMEPGSFALVGMAAVFSAAARAPLTSVVIAFELTGDYEMVLPLMLACGLATFIADRINSDSVYSHPLRAQGIVYAEPQDVDIMQTVRVREIMLHDPPTIAASTPLPEVLERFAATSSHGFPVVETRPDGGDRLVGVITIADLGSPDGRALEEAPPTAGEICTRRPLTVTPEDPVFRAIRRMATADVGRLPVVASDDHGRLVGFVRRTDVVSAYQRAITRSLGVQQRSASSRLRDLGGTVFTEFIVTARAPVAERMVRDVAWPSATIVTSVRREGGVITPRGDTVLQADDEVVVLTEQGSIQQVRELITGHAMDES